MELSDVNTANEFLLHPPQNRLKIERSGKEGCQDPFLRTITFYNGLQFTLCPYL